MSRWHHGHSIGSGVVGGLLIANHPWLLIALGIALGYGLAKLGAVMRWIGRRFA